MRRFDLQKMAYDAADAKFQRIFWDRFFASAGQGSKKMSKWHAATICQDCWDKRHPDSIARRVSRQGPAEKCCFCGKDNEDRIYIREDADTLPNCEHATKSM
jgi:hypothetical protein